MREHIEFIQSQYLPWVSGLPGGLRPEVLVRTLSRDHDDGACSLIVRYPAGFACDGESLAVDEELFVLSGSLEIDGECCGTHGYVHLPRGYQRRGFRSARGAEVITFFSSEPRYSVDHGRSIADAPGSSATARLVRHSDTRNLAVISGPRKHMASEGFNHGGTVHKLLFDDPLTKDKTWLAGLPPYWSCDTIETHPVCEEEFALAGDIHMPNGVMHAGAYFWRPANVPHGPFGTVGGTLHLCRGKGGLYSTSFQKSATPFVWDPVYRPILPPNYQAYVPSPATPLA
jgi:hypothetical protein